jgi:tRNA pseudouridine65 synthase
MQVLHIDSHLVIVDKPAGLLVHRSAIDRHETHFALQMVRDRIGARVYPVHRLDKPTAGVLVFARDPEVARVMTEKFARGEVEKRYLAVVRGHVDAQGVIDYPLLEALDAMTDRRAKGNKPAQEAFTEYRCLGRAELPYAVGRYATARYSLVEAVPRTGRKHQIRRHMKHVFHPIVGDTTHGDGKQNRFFREHLGVQRLLLVARGMSFAHPGTNEPMVISAPLDGELRRIGRLLGWDEILAGVNESSLTPGPSARENKSGCNGNRID